MKRASKQKGMQLWIELSASAFLQTRRIQIFRYALLITKREHPPAFLGSVRYTKTRQTHCKKKKPLGAVYRQMVTPLWVDKQCIPCQVSSCSLVTPQLVSHPDFFYYHCAKRPGFVVINRSINLQYMPSHVKQPRVLSWSPACISFCLAR